MHHRHHGDGGGDGGNGNGGRYRAVVNAHALAMQEARAGHAGPVRIEGDIQAPGRDSVARPASQAYTHSGLH